MKKKILLIGLIVLCIPFGYVAIVHSLMAKAANQEAPDQITHLLILGAKLNGETMSLSLYYRVQKALQYLNENENTIVIVSGGQGEGEAITEAKAMANFLLENGIAEDRIILEENATNTYENVAFTRKILGDEIRELIVVSNDFHLFRSMVIARRQGFEPYPLAAQTPLVVRGKLWTREYAAIIKTWIYDW